jgi:hypothetical protein
MKQYLAYVLMVLVLSFPVRAAEVSPYDSIDTFGNLLAHASSSKRVTLVLFSDRYFQSRFLTAGRIVRY